MRYLLDADWVIDYLAGRPQAQALYPTLERDGMAVSTPTLIELYTGVYGNRNPRQAERQLRAFLRAVTILRVTRQVALRTARLRRELLDRRLPIRHRAYDIITAATALSYDLTLVTSNTRDFGDIPHLTLYAPRSSS